LFDGDLEESFREKRDVDHLDVGGGFWIWEKKELHSGYFMIALCCYMYGEGLSWLGRRRFFALMAVHPKLPSTVGFRDSSDEICIAQVQLLSLMRVSWLDLIFDLAQ